MIKIHVPAIIGSLLIILGLTVIHGWIFHLPMLVQILPGYIGMAPNTAFCFILSGICLIYSARTYSSKPHNNVLTFIGIAISCLSLTVFLQDVFNLNFGVDQLLIKVWLNDANPTPGRMAPNTAICFTLLGLSFILMNFAHKKTCAILIQIISYLVFVIALLGFIGYTLNLSFLYSWYHYGRMAAHTACGLMILCCGLWTSCSLSDWYQQLYAGKEDRKLLIFSSAILLSVALTAGLIGFSLTAKQTENSLQSTLLTLLNEKKSILNNTINNQLEFLDTTNDRFYKDKKLSQSSGHSLPNGFINSLILHGYKAIQITDDKGAILYTYGSLIKKPAISTKLSYNNMPILFWDNGWGLMVTYPIKIDSHIKMTLIVEKSLAELNQLSDSLDKLSPGAELVLCYQASVNSSRCFPNQFNPHAFSIVFKNIHLRPRLIGRALSGEMGVATGYDYRDNSVVAAFSPVDNSKLAMVLKINANKLYQQTREQLNFAVPIILIVILIGIGLIYLLILPLMKGILNNQRKLQESEERFKASFESAAIGMALISLNAQWLKVNNALCHILGYSTTEIRQTDFYSIMHAEDIAKNRDFIARLLDKQISSYQLEARYFHKEGALIWISLNVSLLTDASDNPLYFISQMQNISIRKNAEEYLYKANLDLEQNNYENQTLSELISNLQACPRLENAYQSITSCCERLFPYCSGMILLRQPDHNYFSSVANWGKYHHINQSFAESECYALTYKDIYQVDKTKDKNICQHSNHGYSYVCVPLISQNESIGLLYLEFDADQTHIEESQYPIIMSFTAQLSLAIANIKLRESLHHESIHDPLTGLYNRRFLDSFILQELFKMKRASSELAVVILDIDHFKEINDTYGHETGDVVLTMFGQLLISKLRESDITCRYGGEEFVLLLSNLSIEQAFECVEKLRLAISKLKFKSNNAKFFSLTASFGIATYPHHGTSPAQLLNAADRALYIAKQEGRNRTVIYQT